jgi:hypothetical protein
MRAMVVEVGPEIEQLVFEVCRRPEQQVIQVFPPQGAVLWRSPLCGVQALQAMPAGALSERTPHN